MKRLIAIAVLILLVLPRLQAQERDGKIEFTTTHMYIFDANAEPSFRGNQKSTHWELNFDASKLITSDDSGVHPLYLDDIKVVGSNAEKMRLDLFPTPGKDEMKIRLTVYNNSPVDDMKVAIYRNKTETGAYATTIFYTTYEVENLFQLMK